MVKKQMKRRRKSVARKNRATQNEIKKNSKNDWTDTLDTKGILRLIENSTTCILYWNSRIL